MKTTFQKTILSEIIQGWQRKRNITNQQSADELGIPLRTYGDWKGGHHIPRGFALKQLNEKLNVSDLVQCRTKTARTRGSRCGVCYWALYDGDWCQNPKCVMKGKSVNENRVILTNEEARILMEAKERSEARRD
ncbi:MAG: helix-turn-helix transcriptional regulator [Patescibacteria group bacterium]|nr:helix-turn-helix transcriptional regulator [Patescibacteria group bacterium]